MYFRSYNWMLWWVFLSSRVTSTLNDEQDKIRAKKELLDFHNIYGNLAREQILITVVREISSSQRNAFREMVRIIFTDIIAILTSQTAARQHSSQQRSF